MKISLFGEFHVDVLSYRKDLLPNKPKKSSRAYRISLMKGPVPCKNDKLPLPVWHFSCIINILSPL